jgi:hypothetical protein
MTGPAFRARRWTGGRALVAAAALSAALGAQTAACQRDGDVGGRGPTPPGAGEHRLHSDAGPAVMTITPDLIRTWSEQLCTQPPLDLAGALRALGITGSLEAKSSDYAIVVPPPAGTSRVGLSLENLGKNKGNLGTVEVTLDGATLTRGELDQRFGAGNALPRVDANRPHVVSYRVEIAGAPFRCTVSASFAGEPNAASAATKISLRRDVVKPPPGQAP